MSDAALPAFDDEVVRAMARWPDVPRCFGWLELDRRGQWRIRGEVIGHARAVAFLGRHYRADAAGRWYVQNGPQQVFVSLEYTPWVLRYDAGRLCTHTGLDARAPRAVCLDDEGNVLLDTPLGVGLLDDRDLAAFDALIEYTGETPATLAWPGGPRLVFETLARAAAAARFGFVAVPAA
ncbi:MAG: DUF2946 family protein [Gammaproteobacteria bacterium]